MQKPPRSTGDEIKVETDSKDPAAVRGQRKETQHQMTRDLELLPSHSGGV